MPDILPFGATAVARVEHHLVPARRRVATRAQRRAFAQTRHRQHVARRRVRFRDGAASGAHVLAQLKARVVRVALERRGERRLSELRTPSAPAAVA
jgi:hypothetical protein